MIQLAIDERQLACKGSRRRLIKGDPNDFGRRTKCVQASLDVDSVGPGVVPVAGDKP